MSDNEYHRLFGDNPGVPCDDAWKNKVLEATNESFEATNEPRDVWERKYIPLEFDPSFSNHNAVVVFSNWGQLYSGGAYIIRYSDGSYHEVTDEDRGCLERGGEEEKNYVPINPLNGYGACGLAEELCAYYLQVGKDYKFTDKDRGRLERGGRYWSNAEPASYESVLSQRFFNKEFDDMLNSLVDDDYKKYLIKEKSRRHRGPDRGPEEFLSLSWEDYDAAVDTAVDQNKNLLVVVRDMLYKGEK